jgi:hypothetical protein
LDEIQIKAFILAIHSHLYSFALKFLFLQTHATSTLELLYTVKEKGGKPDRKPYPLPFGLRNPYRNIKSEKLQDYAQKPQLNCTFINSVSAVIRACTVWRNLENNCTVVFALIVLEPSNEGEGCSNPPPSTPSIHTHTH